MGRTNKVERVRTLTVRTNPSLPWYTDSTSPSGHRLRGVFSSAIKTRSPTPGFGWTVCHLSRHWRTGKYKRTHFFQKTLAKCWTCHYRLRNSSCLLNSPGGNEGPSLSSRRWFGVSGVASFGSSLDFVNGLPFKMDSTSTSKVSKISSVSWTFERMAFKTFLTAPTMRSQTPPTWAAVGGLNCQSILFLTAYSWTLSGDMSCMDKRISFSPPTKLVPLSEKTFFGTPRLATKRRNALINEFVSRQSSFSKWTARVTMHDIMHPYRFISDRPRFTKYGPNASVPTNVKGGSFGDNRSKLTMPYQNLFSLSYLLHWQPILIGRFVFEDIQQPVQKPMAPVNVTTHPQCTNGKSQNVWNRNW